MKILQFRAENFKRLSVVSIKPDGSIINISGRNGAGKSSVLDAIWAALGGAENMPAVPVRAGADEAIIRLDLGEYIVTRKIKNKEDGTFTTGLVVEGADGVRAKSPQAVLNGLVGRFCLDPMAFVRMTPKEQFDALKYMVPGLDLDEIKAKDESDRERRTAENRKAKEAAAAASVLGAKDGKSNRVDVQAITADIARASEHNQSIAERQTRRTTAGLEVSNLKAKIVKDHTRMEELKAEIDRLVDAAKIDLNRVEEVEAKIANAEALPAPLDTADLARQLSEANTINVEADKQERRDALMAMAQTHEKASNTLTAAIEARAEQKKQAIASAKFPVDGLSLGEEEVLVNDLPFAQAATSQKIRTAMAIAMAANPAIRVIRIEDGSLLDADALKIVADVAKDQDFQVWVETVSDGTGSGIIIEDGQLKEN